MPAKWYYISKTQTWHGSGSVCTIDKWFFKNAAGKPRDDIFCVLIHVLSSISVDQIIIDHQGFIFVH